LPVALAPASGNWVYFIFGLAVRADSYYGVRMKGGDGKLAEAKSKKLEDLEKKIEQLKAQKQAEEARIRARAKKDDTRRKILVGAYFLEQAQRDGTMTELVKKIDPFLTRKGDRLLFDLPEKQTQPEIDSSSTVSST
jgi:large subunit ribosomal protein L7/L12